MHIIYFTLFFLYFFFLGRGLVLAINKMSKKTILDDDSKLFETTILIFYPIIGIIFFSNLMFISNFFFALKNPFLLIVVSTFILFNFFHKINILKYKYIYLVSFINSTILSISSYDINFQYDAGYYHLNYQNWLREYKLIFGLNNLNAAFGTSSIIDYVSAPLWIGNNLILLHYVTIFFLVVLGNFLFYHIFISNNKYFSLSSILLIIFGLFDNFGMNGGRNGFFTIHGIIKPDVASGIIFYLCSIFLTYTLLNKKYKFDELLLLNFLIIFSYQLKISSVLLLLFLFGILIKSKVFSFKLLLITNSILFLWLIKNIFLTSCLIYPVEITCLQLPWYNIDAIIGIKNVTSDFNNSYLLGTSFILWFNDWIAIEINKTIIYNFLWSFGFLLIIKSLLTKITKKNNFEDLFIPVIFLIGNLIIWILGAAHPRFVYGVFAYIISMLVLNYKNIEIKYNKSQLKKLVFLSLFIFTTILIPRINSYKTFLQDPFKVPEITAPVVKYKKINSNWVLPKDGDQCWINLDCIPYNKNIYSKKYFSYNGFIINN